MTKSKITVGPYDHSNPDVLMACGLDKATLIKAQKEILDPLPEAFSMSEIVEAIENANIPLRIKLGVLYAITRHEVVRGLQMKLGL